MPRRGTRKRRRPNDDEQADGIATEEREPQQQQQDEHDDVQEQQSADEGGSEEEEDHVQEPSPIRKAGRKRGRQALAPPQPAPSNISLFEIVKSYPAAVDLVAKDWAVQYQQDRASATAKLLTLVIQVCGVQGMVISAEQVEEGETDVLVQQLSLAITQSGGDNPLQQKGGGGRASGAKVRDAYLEALEALVRELAACGGLFDDYVMDKATNLAIALSCSVVRSFRYAATLTACQLVSSWTRVLVSLGQAREAAHRQLAAEERKGPSSKAARERVAAFRRSAERCHTQMSYLRDMTAKVYQAVSAHRFRDISEEVRAVVIAGIGSWVELLPSEFLSDQYLKYLAWALSDKDPLVRGTAVDALLAMYSRDDNISPLHDFTSRFSGRFGELLYDVDEGVAVKGLSLLAELVKAGELSWHSVWHVYGLLLEESRPLRTAAAALVAQVLPELGRVHLEQLHTMAGGDTPRQRRRAGATPEPLDPADATDFELQLAGMVHVLTLMAADQCGVVQPSPGSMPELDEVYAEDGLVPLDEASVEQVVGALYHSVPVLHEWTVLVDAVQAGQLAGPDSYLQTTSLLLLLRAAVQVAVDPDAAVVAAGPARGRAAATRKKASEAQRQSVTLLLSRALPGLITRFQADAGQVQPLCGLVRCLKLEVYAAKGQERGFEALMRQVGEVVFKHAAQGTVDECAKALALASSDDAPGVLRDKAQLVVDGVSSQLCGRLARSVEELQRLPEEDLAAAVADLVEGGAGEEEEALYHCRVSLMRMHRLLLHCSGGSAATQAQAYDAINSLLEDLAGGADYGPYVAGLAVLCSQHLLLWRLDALLQASAGTATTTTSAGGGGGQRGTREDDAGRLVDELNESRALLVNQLQAIGAKTQYVSVQDTVLAVLADLVSALSSSPSGAPQPALEPVCLDLNTNGAPLLAALWGVAVAVLERDVPAEEEEEGDEEEEEGGKPLGETLQSKVTTVVKLGRLLLHGKVPQGSWLASALASRWVQHEQQVADAVQQLMRALRKQGGWPADRMSDLHVAAVQRCFAEEEAARAGAGAQLGEATAALCARVAGAYVGIDPANGQALRVCKGLVAACHQSARGGGGCVLLDGVACFLPRLTLQQAEALSAVVAAQFAGLGPQEGDEEGGGGTWGPYFGLLAAIKARLDKAAKGAERAAAGRKRGGRRGVSFAEGARDENEESRGGSGSHLRGRSNRSGGGSSRRSPAASGATRSQPSRAGRPGSMVEAAHTPAGEEEEQEEWEGAAALPRASSDWRSTRGRGKQPAASMGRPVMADGEEGDDDEDEEEEEEGADLGGGDMMAGDSEEEGGGDGGHVRVDLGSGGSSSDEGEEEEGGGRQAEEGEEVLLRGAAGPRARGAFTLSSSQLQQQQQFYLEQLPLVATQQHGPVGMPLEEEEEGEEEEEYASAEEGGEEEEEEEGVLPTEEQLPMGAPDSDRKRFFPDSDEEEDEEEEDEGIEPPPRTRRRRRF